MKFSKQAILARFHKMPVIRFEDQQLTSFGGVMAKPEHWPPIAPDAMPPMPESQNGFVS